MHNTYTNTLYLNGNVQRELHKDVVLKDAPVYPQASLYDKQILIYYQELFLD